jgi:hypothetical protein
MIIYWFVRLDKLTPVESDTGFYEVLQCTFDYLYYTNGVSFEFNN